MFLATLCRAPVAMGLLVVLAGCGGLSSAGSGLFGGARDGVITEAEFESRQIADEKRAALAAAENDGRRDRGTICVQDPALDARSLKVALQSRGGGTVPVETQRAVEDAILTRARQIRIRDSKL